MRANIKNSIFVWTAFLVIVLFSKSYAHFLWLSVDDYTPDKGQEITITLGWGHKFPETPKPPREEMVKKLNLFLIDPDGREIPISIKIRNGKPQPVKIKLAKKGVYLAVATTKHFVSKTTEGYFYKAKDELKDKEIIYSKWSETTAIALISVGKSSKINISTIPNSNFYLLPTTNPSSLKEGEVFQVKVLFHKKKPYRGWVYATYEGFSEFKDTFAWATRTDRKGMVNIKILKKANWLIKTEAEKPYSNTSKADFANYKCTVTFGF